jgi:hypothetical protein
VFPQNIARPNVSNSVTPIFYRTAELPGSPKNKKQTNKQTHPELFMEPRAEIGKSFPDMREQQASKY